MTALPVEMDPDRVDVQLTTSADGCSVTVTGEVDASTAPGMRGALLAAVAHGGSGPVRVDLSGVTFLDSAGLAALAAAHRAAQGAGRELRVRCGTARAVVRPLQITGLWDVFTVDE